ncbi:4'-phosphopantetheinyl transferase SFP-like protein, partial [Leptotrombidium deliense]
KQALIGRLMMRKCVSTAFSLPSNAITFGRSEKGKPILDKELVKKLNTNYDFNVSHNGNFAVLAADCKRKVGVDVMNIEYKRSKELSEFFRLMNRQFSDDEWIFIRAADSDREKMSRFIRLWCLKESFVKAEGFGITVDLQNISFICKTVELSTKHITNDTLIRVNGSVLKNWVFEESLLDTNHCVAVAYEIQENENKTNDSAAQLFQVLTFDKIIENVIEIHKSDDSVWDTFANKAESAT